MRGFFVLLSILSWSSHAATLEEVVLPVDGWYQIQRHGVTLCETGWVEPCRLAPGTYTRINHSTGERDRNYVVQPTPQVHGTVQTVVRDSRPSRIIEMHCPGSDKAAVSITCAAYLREDNGDREIVLVNAFVSAPAYLGTDGRADYDGACVTDEPAYITATLHCARISSYERIDD